MTCPCRSESCSRKATYAPVGAVQAAIDEARATYSQRGATIAETVALERVKAGDWWKAYREQAWRDLGLERGDHVRPPFHGATAAALSVTAQHAAAYGRAFADAIAGATAHVQRELTAYVDEVLAGGGTS